MTLINTALGAAFGGKRVRAICYGNEKIVGATNLLTNPSFETTSGTVEVRRNHIFNPRGIASGSPWGTNTGPGVTSSGSTVTVATPEGVTTAHRRTLTGAPSSWFYVLPHASASATGGDLIPVTPGETVATSGRYWHSRAVTAEVRIGFRTDANAFVSWGGVAEANVAAGSTGPGVLMSTSAVVPEGAAWAYVVFGWAAGSAIGAGVGDWVQATAATATKGAALPGHFDGTVSPDSDLTPSWTGAKNASASILTGARTTGAAFGADRAVVSSTQWSASQGRSIRVIPTSPVVDGSGASLHTFSTADVGKTYTALATCRLAAPQTGSTVSTARTISLYGPGEKGAQAPNETGAHPLRWTFTVNTAGQSLRLITGSAAGGGDVWWDDVMLVEGVYDGPYRDGTFPGWYWTGPDHASASSGWQ